MDLARLILIVTGAHLNAELAHRPLAYSLQRAMLERLGRRGTAIVCSDVWYMNNDQLRGCPTISIGGPALNALSAFLADKLPSAYVVDGRILIQADPEFEDPIACCWGADDPSTAAAVDTFKDRYLDAFLIAATRSWLASN